MRQNWFSRFASYKNLWKFSFQNFLMGFRTQTSTTFDLLDHKLSENFGYIFLGSKWLHFILEWLHFFRNGYIFLGIIFFQNGYILVPHQKFWKFFGKNSRYTNLKSCFSKKVWNPNFWCSKYQLLIFLDPGLLSRFSISD